MEDIEQNYEKIIKECGFGTKDSDTIIRNIANLEEFYDSTELVNIYNYCLLNIKDADILFQVIKYTDAHRSTSTLSILSDMLLKKIAYDDNDSYINVRALCAKAIANYKDIDCMGILLYCLNDKNEHYKVRLACADALGRLGNKYAVKPLIDVVKDEEEKSIYLKESATFALGMLGDTSAIDPLISILESKQGFIDKFTFLKEKIVEALGKLNSNNKNILKALNNSLMDPSPIVRINAIEGIMNSNDENAEEMIRPCLRDEDLEVQKNALIALYNLIGNDILDEVISLPIYSENLKSEAANMLREYEDGDEIE